MPKLVSELAQGNTFSRSSDGGSLAESATRVFKVVLNAPNETFDIEQAIGVTIGSIYSQFNPIPCVSIEGRADGESRLVRIITAQYRASAGGVNGAGGGGGGGAQDPRSQPPEIRPATYSLSTTLQETPAWGWHPKAIGDGYGAMVPAANPVGDIYDGVTKLEPVTTITIEQYMTNDGTAALQFCGFVNSDPFTFSGLGIGVHQCMLQSVSSKGHVENFGGSTFRGFQVTYTFVYRKMFSAVAPQFGGNAWIGWDVAIPISGFNVINGGIGRADVDRTALALAHERYVLAGWPNAVRVAKDTGGKKVRAHVLIAARNEEDSATQNLASQPVPLNLDGTPRKAYADDFGAAVVPPVLIGRYSTQPERTFGNDFADFGIRGFY